jgi:hypothetical protein
MKKQYDFSKGKRGTVIAPAAGKTRITKKTKLLLIYERCGVGFLKNAITSRAN